MKKLFLLTVLCALVGTAAFGATLKRTILSHGDMLTQYDANNWQGAITDAVDGDIVYFTSGLFTGDLTIDKAITLIGAGVAETDAFWYNSAIDPVYTGNGTSGESTIIDGSITIAIPGSKTLTKPVMEGFRVQKITVTEPVTGLTIKRCQVNGYWYSSFVAEATVTNLTLENCYIQDIQCANLVTPTIRNCYAENLIAVPTDAVIRNCMVIKLRNIINCTFINCGYHNLEEGSSYNTFVNCLYRDGDVNSTYSNCVQVDEPAQVTKAQMTENSWYGNDNTFIGPVGGSYPFTLIPSQPSVKTNSINYDSSKKELNVNLTIKQGK